MNAIRIGLLGKCAGWRLILNQLRVPWQHIETPDQVTAKAISCLVLSAEIPSTYRLSIDRYIQHGGTLLAFHEHAATCCPHTHGSPIYVRTLLGDGPLFAHTGLIFVERWGRVISGASHGRINNSHPAVYTNTYGSGHVILLPVDVGDAAIDLTCSRRGFRGPGRTINENVATVSKGGLCRLVMNCLKRLHHWQGLPLAHLWYYRGRRRSAFNFRVDVDQSTEGDLETVRRTAAAEGQVLTWFFNVIGNHHHRGSVRRLQHEGHEIQSHNFEHEIFDSPAMDAYNIRRADAHFRHNGIPVSGFAAPAGKFSVYALEALGALRYQFSSDFAYDYDNIPSYPILRDKEAAVLEIPVHPVCVGLMLDKGYTEVQMQDYFRTIVRQKYAQGLPLFFYGHPAYRLSNYPQVLACLLRELRTYSDVYPTRLCDFAEWWHQRRASTFAASADTDHVLIFNVVCCHPELHVRLLLPDDREVLLPLQAGRHRLRDLEARKSSPPPSTTYTLDARPSRDSLRRRLKETRYRISFFLKRRRASWEWLYYRLGSSTAKHASLSDLLEKHVPLAPGDRVLHAGSSRGYLAHHLASQGVVCVGMDMVFPDLLWKNSFVPRGPRTSVSVCADLQHLPSASDTFDHVVCSRFPPHIPDPEALIQEFAKVLRRGGSLILSVPSTRRFRILHWLLALKRLPLLAHLTCPALPAGPLSCQDLVTQLDARYRHGETDQGISTNMQALQMALEHNGLRLQQCLPCPGLLGEIVAEIDALLHPYSDIWRPLSVIASKYLDRCCPLTGKTHYVLIARKT